MKKQIFTSSFLLLFSFFCSGQKSVKKALDNLPVLKENNPVAIMILGTFHFNYAENISDVKGENNFDINTEKRQQELSVIIEKIKQFKPTKIAVEMMIPNQKRMDSLFSEYKNGNWKLETGTQ